MVLPTKNKVKCSTKKQIYVVERKSTQSTLGKLVRVVDSTYQSGFNDGENAVRRNKVNKWIPLCDEWLKTFKWAGKRNNAYGCLKCEATGSTTSWGKFRVGTGHSSNERPVMKSMFVQHEKTEVHREAMREAERGQALVGTPTSNELETVVENIRTNGSCGTIACVSDGVDLKIGRKKKRKMLYCVAEAMRDAHRARVAASSTLGLMQDERKGRLLVRFKSCTTDLKGYRGILGQKKVANSTAESLKDQTLKLIRRFCTMRRRIPHKPKKRSVRPRLRVADHRRILKITEFFAADGAENEQLAGRLMKEAKSQTTMGLWRSTCPNLRIVERDRAHALRRVTKRPWTADKRLARVIDKVFFSKHSVTRLIQYSHVFKEWHHDNLARQTNKTTDSNRTTDLGFAPQRFDSSQVPLGRAVTGFEALLCTASQISEHRQGSTEGKNACAFLEFIDERQALLMACLADAADEADIITR